MLLGEVIGTLSTPPHPPVPFRTGGELLGCRTQVHLEAAQVLPALAVELAQTDELYLSRRIVLHEKGRARFLGLISPE